MIDLTPLDVRNKRGDFKKLMRGYDPQEVDVFLELVAERLEALVRENIQLRDRTSTLQEQVEAQAGREQAVQDALVTAQELRKDIRDQSQREADHIMREAESEARRMVAEAEAEVRSRLRDVERQLDRSRDSLQELERRRKRFLKEFRGLLQRELDVVQVEEERRPLDDRTVDLDLGRRPGRTAPAGAPDPAGASAKVAGAVAPARDVSEDREATDLAEVDAAEDGDVLDDDVGELSHRDEPLAAEGAGSAPVDVADLKPEVAEDASTTSESKTGATSKEPKAPKTAHPAGRGASPLTDEPTSLELELMAGVGGEDDGADGSSYPDVPDLETVLAEAGIDEVRPPAREEISPPPAGGQKPVDDDDRRPEDRLALFDKDDKKGKKG